MLTGVGWRSNGMNSIGTQTITNLVHLRAMKHLIAFLILSISVVFGSCTSTTTPAVTYPALYGQVLLEDSTGTLLPTPYSGITVSVPGFGDSVHTDSLGNWNMANPPQGNYNVVFSKNGFGSTSFPENYIITNNSDSWSEQLLVALTKAPDSIVRVEKVLVFDSTSPWTPASMAMTVTATSQRVFFFIDTLPNVPSTGVHLSYPTELYYHVANEWGNADLDGIGYLGLHHGQTVYVTACAGSESTQFLDSNNHEVLGYVGPSSNVYPVVYP
jgi:hypothetical protein